MLPFTFYPVNSDYCRLLRNWGKFCFDRCIAGVLQHGNKMISQQSNMVYIESKYEHFGYWILWQKKVMNRKLSLLLMEFCRAYSCRAISCMNKLDIVCVDHFPLGWMTILHNHQSAASSLTAFIYWGKWYLKQ